MQKSLGAGRQFSHKSATACPLVREERRGMGGREERREEKKDLLTKVGVGSFQKVGIKHLLCIRPGYKTRTLVIRTRAWRGSKARIREEPHAGVVCRTWRCSGSRAVAGLPLTSGRNLVTAGHGSGNLPSRQDRRENRQAPLHTVQTGRPGSWGRRTAEARTAHRAGSPRRQVCLTHLQSCCYCSDAS